MKFALLGDRDAAVPWLETLTAGGHSCREADWGQLLIDRDLDAVLVAGDADEVQSAAKQLATEGRPLLIVPAVAWGISTAYELSLVRDDSGVVLMPAFVHRGDAELKAMSERLRSGSCGTVRRLQIDVELAAVPATNDSLTEAEIESAALPCVDLLRWLGGNYDQVTSLRSGQSECGCSQATLNLAGSGLPDGTWTARRGVNRRWRLTVETDRETLQVERQSFEPSEASCGSVIEAFSAALRGEAASPDWSDAVRAFDVLDAARRSLRRRRTIDLHFETLSERQQFKTQMTAIGCGLLVLTLVLMLGLLGLGALFDARDRSVRDAQAAGLVVSTNEFQADTAEFSPAAGGRLDQMAERLQSDLTTAFVEPSVNPANVDLDQRRRDELVKQLANRGVIAADHRTRIAPAQNHRGNTLLRVLRIAWIVPLVIFLSLQVLLFIAKPAADREPLGGEGD